MYEIHGWFALHDSTYESDFEHERALVGQLQSEPARLELGSGNRVVDLRVLNGTHVLTTTGMSNHRAGVERDLYRLLDWIATHLPGAYGLLRERDDEPGLASGTNAFTVHVPARGQVSLREDPFLSPAQPIVED